MRPAIASNLSFVLLGFGLALGACDNGSSLGGDDGGDVGGNCIEDTSNAASNAIAITSGMATEGMICPRGDSDWYSLDVPAGSTLVDVSVAYPTGTVTKVNLSAQLYAPPDGMNPTPNGNLIGKSKIGSTLLAPAAGKYFLSVRDAMNADSDSLNSYVLTATVAQDPDTHEPNDDIASAKAPDGKPGWFAYQGDVDVYSVTVPTGSALIRLGLTNPASSKQTIHYQVQDSNKNVLVDADSIPSDTPYDAIRSVGGPGTYYVFLTSPMAAPDRTQATQYSITLSSLPELDANEPNNSGSTATCLSSGCSYSFNGSNGQSLPTQTGSVGSLGDRDFYRVDMDPTATQAGIIDAKVTINSMIDLALDIYTPDPASPCTKDSDCAALNQPCSADSDCELSHTCLPPDNYAFCQSPPCRLCVGASACVPGAGGAMQCAAPQYLVHSSAGGGQTLHTAQPMFNPGPYYVVVHDYMDQAFDYGTNYTLDVKIAAEPDPNDQNVTMRNNLYNPYPMQMDDLSPSMSRAVDISAALVAGQQITGYVSYQTDEDWYVFDHPCPGMDCALYFQWTQPGPSPVQMYFLMRQDDQSVHESWNFGGTVPTNAPSTQVFGMDGDCHHCSFAGSTYSGKYYLQVTSKGETAWDYSSNGQYSFGLTNFSATSGCPSACSQAPMGKCYCWCSALNMCPPPQ